MDGDLNLQAETEKLKKQYEDAEIEYIITVKEIGENLDMLTPRQVLEKARSLKFIDALEFTFEKIFRELEKK